MDVDGEVTLYYMDKESERQSLKISTNESVLTLKTRIAEKLKVGLPEIKIYINGFPFEDTVNLAGISKLDGGIVLVKDTTADNLVYVSDEDPGQDSLLRAADLRNAAFLNKTPADAELLQLVKDNNMRHFYESACKECGWKADAGVISAMEKLIAEEQAKYDEALENAKENAGEVEVARVKTQMAELAQLSASVDDTVKRWEAVVNSGGKTTSTQKRIEVGFKMLKLFMAYNDWEKFNEQLEKSKELVEGKGDWTALNILRTFEAMSHMRGRRFEEAADLFLSSIATFTATDIMTYDKYLEYTILCCCLAKDRKTLKKKILQSSDAKAANVPLMWDFLTTLVDCKYRQYYATLLKVMDYMSKDRHLNEHVHTYFRGMRLKVYKQYFVAFKTVTLKQLAETFGVTIDFVDRDLADFIFHGKLTCKIDKAAGVVVSERQDPVNEQYQKVVRLGDQLLNKISRLSHLINV